MTRAVRPFLALAATIVTAVAVAACGGVPGNAVATVDGTAIQKSAFDHWLGVAAKSSGQANAAVPDPPDYAKCVATKRKSTPKPAKGQPKVTDEQLKTQCKQEYTQLRDQVLQLLISFQWIQGEADSMGIKVSDADVKKSFDQQKKQSFPKDADYQKFLKQSGQTEQDIMQRVRLDLLSGKIRDAVVKGKDKVSQQQIQAFYTKNKSRFAQPERRDLSIVLTKDKGKADQARRALQSGQSFKAVAKKYSIDQQSKNNGGKLPAQAKGTLEAALDKAVFAAPKNKIEGPVKTQFGYYVFQVTNISPASQQSLAQATPVIKQTLASQNQQTALNKFVTDFRTKWRAKTECREGYTTSDCKNGPKPTPTPTTGGAGTGAPTTPGQ